MFLLLFSSLTYRVVLILKPCVVLGELIALLKKSVPVLLVGKAISQKI